MTVTNPPVFTQSGGQSAEQLRRMVAALLADRGGPAKTTDFAVTATTPTASMAVRITAGRYFLPGVQNTFQGTYFLESRASETRTIAAASGSQDRVDRVIIYLTDAAYAGSVTGWDIAVITGTNAAPGSAVAPSIPAVTYPNAQTLALVNVTAGLSAVTSAQITDARSPYTAVAPGKLISFRRTGQDTAGGTGTVISGTISNAPAGVWDVDGLANIGATANGASTGYIQLLVNSAQVVADRRDLVNAIRGEFVRVPNGYTHAGGDLNLSLQYVQTGGSAVDYGVGGQLNARFLG